MKKKVLLKASYSTFSFTLCTIQIWRLTAALFLISVYWLWNLNAFCFDRLALMILNALLFALFHLTWILYCSYAHNVMSINSFNLQFSLLLLHNKHSFRYRRLLTHSVVALHLWYLWSTTLVRIICCDNSSTSMIWPRPVAFPYNV